jgi:Gluconate 2-dehydrogenase subunit 3
LNVEHQPLMRDGLAWLDAQAQAQFSRHFLALDEEQQIAMLQPVSDEVDRQQRDAQRRRFRAEAKGRLVYDVAVTDRTSPAPPSVTMPAAGSNAADPTMPVRLFRLLKNLTADGYYTSRVGLLEELGYTGNTALASFPACEVREQ